MGGLCCIWLVPTGMWQCRTHRWVQERKEGQEQCLQEQHFSQEWQPGCTINSITKRKLSCHDTAVNSLCFLHLLPHFGSWFHHFSSAQIYSGLISIRQYCNNTLIIFKILLFCRSLPFKQTSRQIVENFPLIRKSITMSLFLGLGRRQGR